MLQMTPAAGAHLSWMLSEGNLQGCAAMRIVVEQDELSLRVDTVRKGDAIYKYGEDTVLLVDERLCRALEGRKLDLEQRPDGKTLTLIG